MTRSRFAPLALPLVFAVSSSCATLARQAFAPPQVDVRDVRLAGIGSQGATINVLVVVHNPNDFRLDADAMHYRVTVDTMIVADADVDERVSIKSRDSAEIRVPVAFGFRQVMAAGSELSKKGTVPFEMTGTLRVLTPFGGITRGFTQHGTFDGLNVSLVPRGR